MLLLLSATASFCQAPPLSDDAGTATVKHLQDYPVIELRRYTVKEGEREHFATYFETYFPEAFQQLGAIVAGQFLERDKPLGFTWIRGYHSMEDRAKVDAEFYYGAVWKEHKAKLNSLMSDSDNVLLLRTLPNRSVPIYPAVDPVTEPQGARGIVIAQIFPVKTGAVDNFIASAEPSFAQFRTGGIREVSVLVTLDATNNFPQLPIRTDGPFVVWLGMAQDATALESGFRSAAAQAAKKLSEAGLLRAQPELVILTPTHRSRLRWR
jgi:hypothetical protein